MEAAQIYLTIIFAVTFFRVFMYTVFPELPAKIKISKEAWEDPRVREVTRAWTNTILTFMTFRAATTFCVLYLNDEKTNFWFSMINILLDIKLFHGMLKNFVYGKEKGNCAIIHRNSTPAMTLQTIVLTSGIFYLIAVSNIF